MTSVSILARGGALRSFAAVAAFALALALPLATARAQAKALTLAEVIDLRQHGVSTRQILRSAREYCIAFALTDSVRRELADSGADTLLVGGLGDACSTVRTAPRPTAVPLIDDEFAHTSATQAFAWGDRRCRAYFETGGVRVANTSSDVICSMRYPSVDLSSSVHLELTVSQLGSTRSGVVYLGFGRVGNSPNHYAVSVGSDRKVALCWNADRQCSPLVSKNAVEAVQAGGDDNNVIAVEVRGQQILVSVNGTPVASYIADNEVVGRVSLGVGPGTSVLLVRLRAQPLQ
jgi:hypothetical protein